MSLIKRYLLVIACLVALTGCAEKDDDLSSEFVIYDLVKLESVTEKSSVYTLQKPDAPEGVVYTANQVIRNEDLEVGDRLLIAYVPAGNAYTSGNILLKGYALITNLNLKVLGDDDIMPEKSQEVYLISAWRSGNYLNMRIMLPYLDSPRKFGLILDPESPDPSRPRLLLHHDMDGNQGTFDRTYYISFDISALTADPQVTGFSLHLNNANLPVNQFDFNF